MSKSEPKTIRIATRGSALALAQSNMVLAQCRAAFPKLKFELSIIRTTGDKLQRFAPKAGENLPKGLFTKELEVALLANQADFAVHSLKDLPTELPTGLILGAVGKRADPRDVLIYRDAEFCSAKASKGKTKKNLAAAANRRGFPPGINIQDLPAGATVATSSTRRRAQVRLHGNGLNVVEIRGNVATRLEKLADQPELDAVVLAAAGFARLGFKILPDGRFTGDAVPDGLRATVLEPEIMLPCVGQGAIGIETRADDARIAAICAKLNDFETQQCVIAERAFLAAMGGGCQSPVAAYGEITGQSLRLRAASFHDEQNIRRGELKGTIKNAATMGRKLAAKLKPK